MSAGITRTVAPSRFLFMTGREIGPPLFFKILRQLGLSLEEFEKLR